jgi:hypothetical protein
MAPSTADSEGFEPVAGRPHMPGYGCVVTPDGATESVVVQGVAERITDAGALASLLAAYRRKYGSGFPDPVDNPVFAVRPRTAIGIIEREAEFSRTATRWTFPT